MKVYVVLRTDGLETHVVAVCETEEAANKIISSCKISKEEYDNICDLEPEEVSEQYPQYTEQDVEEASRLYEGDLTYEVQEVKFIK